MRQRQNMDFPEPEGPITWHWYTLRVDCFLAKSNFFSLVTAEKKTEWWAQQGLNLITWHIITSSVFKVEASPLIQFYAGHMGRYLNFKYWDLITGFQAGSFISITCDCGSHSKKKYIYFFQFWEVKDSRHRILLLTVPKGYYSLQSEMFSVVQL